MNSSRNERYRRLITLKRALIITIIISLPYLGIFMPNAIYYSGYKCTASTQDRLIYQQFIIYFNITMSNSIPVIIPGIFFLLRWYNLGFTRHIRPNHFQQQVNRMMIVEFTMVFVSSLPNFILNISTFYIYYLMSSVFRRNVKSTLCFKKQNQVVQKQQKIQLQNVKTTRQAPTKILRHK